MSTKPKDSTDLAAGLLLMWFVAVLDDVTQRGEQRRLQQRTTGSLILADEAARRFARAIDAGTGYTVIPWQMGVVAKLLRLLPNLLFDRIFARAGRKPRGLLDT